MTRVTVFLILSAFLLGCDKNQKTALSADNRRPPELTFPLDSVSANYNKLYQAVETSTGTSLYVLNPYINGIDVYDVAGQIHYKRIILSTTGPLGIKKITGFYVFSADSILVFSDKSLNGLFLINGKPSKRVSDYISFDEPRANFHIASAVPVIAYKRKLYIYALPFKRDPAFSRFQDLDYVLDFENKKVDRVFSRLLYEDVQKWGSLSLPTRCLNPNMGTIVYSYPFLDELLIYNIESKEYGQKKLNSSYFSDATRPLAGYSDKRKALLENNYYDALVFNSYTQRYYRFSRQYIDALSITGEPNTVYNQPVSIIVADAELNKLEEVKLSPPEQYLIKDFFVTKNGLYISSANNYNEDIHEDSLSFYHVIKQ